MRHYRKKQNSHVLSTGAKWNEAEWRNLPDTARRPLRYGRGDATEAGDLSVQLHSTQGDGKEDLSASFSFFGDCHTLSTHTQTLWKGLAVTFKEGLLFV